VSIVFLDVENIRYVGQLNYHLLKYIPPILTELRDDTISYCLDESMKSNNFILSLNNQNYDNQFNFIQNNDPQKAKINTLLFCNRPESIQYAMSLYKKEYIKGSSKLLFFHKNVSNQNGYITVILNNYGNNDIFYTGGLGGPSEDEIFIGRKIFENYTNSAHQGFFSSKSLKWSFYIKNNTVLGGIIDFLPVDAESEYGIEVYFTYSKSDKIPPVFKDVNEESYEYREVNENIGIDNIFKTYNIRFGASKLLSNATGKLDGNYGVNHNYNLIFSNEGVYDIHFVPNGGAAGLSCLIDDVRYQLFSNSESKIVELVIDRPKIVQIQTFPLPGSNYPVTITVKMKR